MTGDPYSRGTCEVCETERLSLIEGVCKRCRNYGPPEDLESEDMRGWKGAR